MFKMQIQKNLNKFLSKNKDRKFFRNLSTFLKKVNKKDLEYTLDLLYKNTNISESLLSHKFKTNVNFNKLLFSVNLNDFDYELIWYIKFFQEYENDLKHFFKLKNILELELINGRYTDALKTLEQIEKDITISYWSIEMKSNILKEFQLVSPSNYINELKKDCKENNLNFFFLNQILIKAETTNNLNFSDTLLETINKFRKEILYSNKSKSSIEYSLGLVDLFSSYLIPLEYDSNRSINHRNLSSFSSLSLIDQYLIFRDYLISRINYGDPFSQSQEKILKNFIENSYDQGLKNTFYPITNFSNLNHLTKRIVKSYSYGKYEDVINLFEENIVINENCISYLDLYVKSLIYLKKEITNDSLYKKISLCMIDIYLSNENSNNSMSYLLNIILKFHHLTWTKPISFFLYQFIESYKVDKKLIKKKLYEFGDFLTPKAFEDFCYKKLVKELKLEKKFMPIYRQNKFMTKSIEIEENYDSNFIEYEKTVIIKSEYIKDHSMYLIKENRIEDCIKFVVNSFLNNINTFVFLPVEKLVEKVDIDDIENVSIDTLILFDIYRKNISLDREEDLNDLYLTFMRDYQTHKPSEIFKDKKTLTNKEIYFLNKICVISIMDSSSKFEGNEQLLSERLSILSILEEYTEDKKTIIDEKNSLYEELSTDELTSSYNNGRIFVDITSFRQIREATYKRLFERYLILRENSNDFENIEEFSTYEHINKDKYEDGFLPSTDLLSFISELYKEHLLNDFVKNQNFGLEKYLSAEIRHGNLKTELRSVFEHNNLVTDEIEVEKKDTIQYEDNNYWLNFYSYLDTDIKNKINEILKDFSSDIDSKLKNVELWLQIITEKEPLSYFKFDYSSSIERLKTLRKKIQDSNDFESFFNNCIDFMWEETYKLINAYKTKLENDLKVSIIESIKELKEKISRESFMNGLGELTKTIDRTENEFSEEINNVLKWFNRVNENIDKSYSFINIVLSTAQLFNKIINNQTTEIKLINNNSNNNYELNYIEARAFMTSMLISLYNARKYSMKTEEQNSIIIDLKNMNNHQLIIKNEINILKNEIEPFISSLKKNFSDKKSELSIKEGGSGLHKIYNLFKNVSSKFYVDIDIENESFFCVYLGVNYENIDN